MTAQLSRSCRWGRTQLRFLPMLVWVAASVGVVALFYTRSAQLEMPGIAEADEHTVASTATGWLNSLPVELFQEVKQGETLAIVHIYSNPYDQTRIQTDQAAAEGELERLKADLLAVEEKLKTDAAQQEFLYSDWYRREALDVETARVAILQVKTVLEPDQILLKDHELEIKIVKDLLAKGAAEPYELQKLQAQYDALAKKIEENKGHLAQAEDNLKSAELRLQEFAKNKPTPIQQNVMLTPIRKAITMQEKRIAELQFSRDTMVITAPFDAVVSTILRRPGETVLAGDPILMIAKKKPRDILAFAGPNLASQVHDNMTVRIVKRTYPQRIAESKVLSVGPTIQMIPKQLWQSPTMPEWGRAIRIAYNQDMDLLPNEIVWVRGF